jgi:acyl-CoA synthetase (AMP-forming)/AMP-acid ligase II/thioesterase domain-containing protein/acyl carrier protein/NADP-dependent 3-hydroxy acid dehydrogenase YdfG
VSQSGSVISTQDETLMNQLRQQIAEITGQPTETITDEQLTKHLLTEIQAVLQQAPNVENCAVILRETAAGTSELVAYLVSSAPIVADRISTHLQNQFPHTLCEKITFMPVASLPYTNAGTLDTTALTTLPVIDTGLIEGWETQLQSVPEIDKAAVLLREESEPPAPLHLSDLLPDWKILPESNEEAGAGLPSEEVASVDESRPKAPSLCSGGPLPDDPSRPQTLPEALQQIAAKNLGDRIVYLQLDGTEIKQSYADLLAEAERILAGLRALGLKPQDKVIFQFDLNQDIISGFWGCILGGFVPVIISIPPTYEEASSAIDKIAHVWNLLDQPLVITSEALKNGVNHLGQWVSDPSAFKLTTIEHLKNNERDKNYHPAQSDDLVFFNLTSGSTGLPKCIGLTHTNLITRAVGTNILNNHTEKDVVLNWLPFDHIGSTSDWHVRCILLGCTLIYVAKEYVLGSPLKWLDLIDKYRITHSWAPNFAYALVNDALKQEPERKWDLSSVSSLLTAGESVSSKAVDDFKANLAPFGFKKTAIRPAFGMAEMASGITYFQPTEETPFTAHVVDKYSLTGTIKRVPPDHPNATTFTDLGPVIPGVSIKIIDNEDNIVPEETIGRFQVKGAPVSPGYYKNPEANKDSFLEDGWFNTGDLAFISNGHLIITGRAKETIIINGANYYNHEIEAVVEEVEGIEVSYTAACAVRLPGEATERLAIFFSPTFADDNLLVDLIKEIRQKMVTKGGLNPDYLIPVEKEVIPKTAIGKIQRTQLGKAFEKGEFDSILKRVDLLLANNNTLPNWFYRKIWQPQVGEMGRWEDGEMGSKITLVFLDNLGLGNALCETLDKDTKICIKVETGSDFAKLDDHHYRLDPKVPEHYQTLIQSLQQDSRLPQQILHLWNYQNTTGDLSNPETLTQAQARSTDSLLYLIKALAGQPVRLFVAGTHTQATTPDDKIAPEQAPVLGILKAASQEIEGLSCRHIDLPGQDISADANALLQELPNTQPQTEVAYRHGVRLVPRLAPADLTSQTKQNIPFKTGGLYLISGGLGGVGVEIAKYLLAHYHAKLLLIGRTPLPARSEWDKHLKAEDNFAPRISTLKSLEHLGEVHYEAVDIADLPALQAIVNQVGQPLDGIIHLAGIATDCRIEAETRDSLAKTFRAKVLGTWTLHQLIKNQPDSLFISFSSVNAFFGGSGAGAYAGANSFLESFTQWQRQNGFPHSYCLSWSMWDEVGMSRGFAMKELSRAQGYYGISAQQGVLSLMAALHRDQPHLLVGLDGANRNIRSVLATNAVGMQTLWGYYTAKVPVNPEKLAGLTVADRFGTPSLCKFRQLLSMPLTETGEIDREQLATVGRRTITERIAPRTDLERTLAEIWQEVLGVPSISINDNFFELGGTSLMAARLFAEVEKKLGKNLPLATLLHAQTIKQLTPFFEATEEETAGWSSLVPIQPEGSKPPLFCMHAAAGNVLFYRDLARHLGKDQPVYGLQARGLDGKQPPRDSIPEMAAAYLEEIRTLQPAGPYYLAGYSNGGIIAYEMAQQLVAQGEKVALLALLDTASPSLLNETQRLLPTANNISAHISNLSQLTWPQKLNYVREKLMIRTGRVKDKFLSAASKLYAGKSGETPVPRTFRDVLVDEANRNAARDYLPQVYPAQVVLFRAKEQRVRYHGEELLGWDGLIAGGVEVYEVPGKHDTLSEGILNEPNVKMLAPQLKQCIEKTLAKV